MSHSESDPTAIEVAAPQHERQPSKERQGLARNIRILGAGALLCTAPLTTVYHDRVAAYFQECTDPSEADLAIVEQLMQQVDDRAEVLVTIEQFHDDGLLRGLQRDHRRVAAEKLGLTIPDLSQGVDLLIADLNQGGDQTGETNSPAMTAVEYLDVANDLLSQGYGVELSLKAPLIRSNGNRSIDLRDLSPEYTRTLKDNIVTTVQEINRMPVEFIHSTGLKRINYVDMSERPEAELIAAEAVTTRGMINLNLNQHIQPNHIDHELFHLWDHSVCGYDYDDDESFSRLNPIPPDDFYTGEMFDHTPARPEYVARVRPEVDPNMETDGSEIEVVARDYGFTFIVEDKATIGELMFSYNNGQGWSNTAETAKSVLDSKMELIFGRMYATDPRLAEYFVNTGDAIFRIDDPHDNAQ